MDDVWFSASDSTASNTPVTKSKHKPSKGGFKQATDRPTNSATIRQTHSHKPNSALAFDHSNDSEEDFEIWMQQQNPIVNQPHGGKFSNRRQEQLYKNQKNIALSKGQMNPYTNRLSTQHQSSDDNDYEDIPPQLPPRTPAPAVNSGGNKAKKQVHRVSRDGDTTARLFSDSRTHHSMNGSVGTPVQELVSSLAANKNKHTNKMSASKVEELSSNEIFDSMSGDDEHGRPVPILIQNEESGVFELDEEALSRILLAPGVEDKYVCVLAVAGAFRKGKSFLLDFLLRYCSNRDKDDWLGDPSEPLRGFKWRQGSKRETTGIMVWSKPFIVTRKTGEQIAVILVDTQGTFDTQSSMKDSTVVFALTMMVSSVLVYNLMNNIQEDDLMNLQTFTSYGIQAQEDCDSSHAFQRLQFLVRDWGFPYETPYGHKGGQTVLDDILQITKKQHTAHQDVRRDIRKCFRDINCYLMPHPGFNVIQSAKFDGRLADIEDEFIKHLRVLVPRLLAPENLVKKEFGGQPIKARDLFKFFQTFMEVFKDIDLPEPTTLVEFAARASSQAAVEAAKEHYVEAMETLVGGDRPFLKTTQMEAEHEKEKKRAVSSYHEKNKYGRKNQRVVEKYQEMLEEEIDKLYLKYQQQNEAKNVFKAARTPATLFCALVLFYILSGVLGMFGVYSLATLCNIAMGVFVIMLASWAYIRYSGEFRDYGVFIDEVATFLWDNFLAPIYSTYMEQPLKNAAEKAAHQAVSSAVTSKMMQANNNSKT